MGERIKLYAMGCATIGSEEFDSVCIRCPHSGDTVACQSYRIENDLTILWGLR